MSTAEDRVQTLHANSWVSLRIVQKPDAGVDGYVYSHESRCQGRIVAVLPYRDIATNGGGPLHRYLVKSEMTPCWGFDQVLSAITGGYEGGDIENDAVREMLEETGYTITRDDLIPLGESYGTKSTDTIYSLFSVDLTRHTPGEALGDGSRVEAESEAVWLTVDELVSVKDPQVAVMYMRLIDHLGLAEPADRMAGHVAPAMPPPIADFGPVRLELMGHRYREGHLSEVVIAGQPFLKLEPRAGAPEFYRPDAIYCLTPIVATAAPVPRAALTERFPDVADDDDDDLEEDPF